MKCKGNTDANFIVRQMQEKLTAKGKKLYFGTVDWKKLLLGSKICLCLPLRKTFVLQKVILSTTYIHYIHKNLYSIKIVKLKIRGRIFESSQEDLRKTSYLTTTITTTTTTTTTTQFPITLLNRTDRSISTMFNISAISSGWRCYLCISRS